jgi:hypothetical protein
MSGFPDTMRAAPRSIRRDQERRIRGYWHGLGEKGGNEIGAIRKRRKQYEMSYYGIL